MPTFLNETQTRRKFHSLSHFRFLCAFIPRLAVYPKTRVIMSFSDANGKKVIGHSHFEAMFNWVVETLISRIPPSEFDYYHRRGDKVVARGMEEDMELGMCMCIKDLAR